MATLTLPVRIDFRYPIHEFILDGLAYKFEFKYHQREDRWYFDLFDAEGTAIVYGIKILLNVSLLSNVASASKPQGTLFVLDTSESDSEAGLEDLGDRVLLVYEEA